MSNKILTGICMVLTLTVVGLLAYIFGKSNRPPTLPPAGPTIQAAGHVPMGGQLPPGLPPGVLGGAGQAQGPGGPMALPPEVLKQMGGFSVQRNPGESLADFQKRVEAEFKAKGLTMPPPPTVSDGASLPLPPKAPGQGNPLPIPSAARMPRDTPTVSPQPAAAKPEPSAPAAAPAPSSSTAAPAPAAPPNPATGASPPKS